MHPRRPPGSRWSAITVLDGVALAALVVGIFAAETFDAARADIQSVAEHRGSEAAAGATPYWLASRCTWLLFAGVFIGLYVTIRFVVIARALEHTDRRKRMDDLRRGTPVIALIALGAWLWWQKRAIDVVEGDYGVSTNELLGLHLGGVGLALIALCLGGAVVGDATLATTRSSLVRLQWLFLLALYLLIFHASFLSDQLTDVLRGWGDRALSRPLAGLAAAVLLGAVVRASASRILLPHPSEQPRGLQAPTARVAAELTARRDRIMSSPWYVGVGLAVAGVLLILLQLFAALVIAAVIVAVLARFSCAAASQPRPDEAGVRGLRRLAGTMGVVPPTILLGGLTAASVNSLLLPSGPSPTDIRLFVYTGVVGVACGLLFAHAHVVVDRSFDERDRVQGEVFGALGLLFAGLSVISTTLAAVLLAGLAFVLASRRYGERGAIELWAAWGVGAGLALAVYLRPVDVPRGLGGFAVAIFGATAILAVLHPLASLGARYRLPLGRFKPRTPVLVAMALWLLLAWLSASPTRNQVPTVDAAKPPETVEAAVDAWLDDLTENPPRTNRSYLPMLLVAASGGGSKAAYWTDLVLDCMLGDELTDADKDECPKSDAADDRYRSLFLTSSASGGSVGVYQLIRHDNVVGRGRPWIADSAGEEVLSPLLAWGLLHDLPAFLLGAPTRPTACGDWVSCRINADRAMVQAAAVAGEDDPADVGTDGGALTAQTGPVTIFNTAQVDRFDPAPLWPRRRVVLSRLSLAEPKARSACPEARDQAIHDAIDGHDLLASGTDVTILSSAVLSARFPVLEPPGWLGSRSQDSDRACGGQSPTEESAKIRDGGTYENTGMLTLVDLLDPIEAAVQRWQRENQTIEVRIVVVSIDDDVPAIEGDEEYDLAGSEPDDPAGRARAARREACRRPGINYVRVSPQPHVGAQAATGWEVSETSRQEDLVNSLRPTAEPGRRVQELRAMLDGTPLKRKCLH